MLDVNQACRRRIESRANTLSFCRIEHANRHNLGCGTHFVGFLWGSVTHRYAQYGNQFRGRLLVYQLKQAVNIRDLDSGGRGLKFTRLPGPAYMAV